MKLPAESIANTVALKKLHSVVNEMLKLSEDGIEAIAVITGSYGAGKTWGARGLKVKLGLERVALVRAYADMNTPNKFLTAVNLALDAIPERQFLKNFYALKTFIEVHGAHVIIIDEAEYALKHSAIADTIKMIVEQTLCPFILIGNEMLPSLVQKNRSLYERVMREMNLGELYPSDVKEILNLLEIRIVNKKGDGTKEIGHEKVFELAKKYNLSLLKTTNALKLLRRNFKEATPEEVEKVFQRVAARK